MSGSNLDGNAEFDEQLRMQELYGDSKDVGPGREGLVPKITEDFVASYQANYGFSNDGSSSSTANVQDVDARTAEEPPQEKAREPTDPRKKGGKRKAESGWFHVQDRNTNVYVSGLPSGITVDEFIQLMSKVGIIMRDP
ncbi:HIV Tat-specific factor 1 [Saguinus oedipus]|uniref:HIV Tat-specific factor 1 n=1 Tax=Saguinus oedipus TaxID=9490 RepID=A0ABQ9VIY3_SAGOE|nr:HIV Tat-specific factor 1 [Saguinus oedipus]